MKMRDVTENSHAPRGISLLQVLVLLGISGMAVAMLLPAVRTAREPARRSQCSNNLKQIGIALHSYHDAFGCFPAAMGGGFENRLSGLVWLLPYIEQQPLWNQVSEPLEVDGKEYPAMGPAPWDAEYPPWKVQISTYQCPSGWNAGLKCVPTNYAFSIGDMAREIHQSTDLRGAFGVGRILGMKDVHDGQAQTIAMAEIATKRDMNVDGNFAVNQPASLLENPSRVRDLLCANGECWKDVTLNQDGRGGRWADGAAGYGMFNTILPPNSPSAAVGGEEMVDGIYSAGSYHPGGGAQVLFVDGSVRYIKEDIDAGDSSHPTPTIAQMSQRGFASPYGVWGAMGTATGGDKGMEFPAAPW